MLGLGFLAMAFMGLIKRSRKDLVSQRSDVWWGGQLKSRPFINRHN